LRAATVVQSASSSIAVWSRSNAQRRSSTSISRSAAGTRHANCSRPVRPGRSGTSRRVVIPLLDYLDGCSWTRHINDEHREVVRQIGSRAPVSRQDNRLWDARVLSENWEPLFR
jgi:selenocysteine-specific elongation factor